MQLSAEQLRQHLSKSLLPMYWIASDEVLLVQECCDLIRAHCRSLGFEERQQFFVDGSFNWQNLQQSDSNLSLFASRKIIEVRLRSAKLDDAGKKALQDYLNNPNPDNLLLIVSPKLEAATVKTKWFQQLESHGALIAIRPVDAAALPAWIASRLRRHGIDADQDALNLLAERVEGNLLAADQEVEKLAVRLLARSEPDAVAVPRLDAKTVSGMVADSSRYNVFLLIDAALAGDTTRALKVLQGLAGEGAEPLMILAMLCREIRSLTRMADRIASGQAAHAVMQSERVWSNRKAAVGAALGRLGTDQLQQLLQRARRIDQSVKGLLDTDPWREMSDVVMLLSGSSTAVTQLHQHTA